MKKKTKISHGKVQLFGFFVSCLIDIVLIMRRCLPVLMFKGLRTKVGDNVKK